MSLQLKDLQDLAETKCKEYFIDKKYDCHLATLFAVNDALKDVDDIDYTDPKVLKAATALSAGLGTWEGPCGAVNAGAVAIGLKYGSSDPTDHKVIDAAWERSGSFLKWFKYNKFGSYDCIDLRAYPYDKLRCLNFVTQGSRKLVDVLTEGNSKVIR